MAFSARVTTDDPVIMVNGFGSKEAAKNYAEKCEAGGLWVEEGTVSSYLTLIPSRRIIRIEIIETP